MKDARNPDVQPGEYYLALGMFTPERFDVMVEGIPRTDYKLRIVDGRQQIYFPALTYRERCTVQIVKRP